MSVRMALAKLCACAAGGAVLGGSAVHVVDHPRPRPAIVHHSKGGGKLIRAYAKARTVYRTRRVAHAACVVRPAERTVTTRTYAMPAPMPAPVEMASSAGVPAIVVGGGSGGGGFGGGFFSGGFFGGSSGNAFFTASTSSGGSTSTSSGGSSTSTGGSSTSTGGSSTSTSSGVSSTSSS